jgi:hypothetical protein
MKWPSIFVTMLLISHATRSLSAADAWDCGKEPEGKFSWTCVANSSQLVEAKAVLTQRLENREEPVSRDGFTEKDPDYQLSSTPALGSKGLSLWLENIPINHHVIQFGAFLSLANANALVESSSLSQDLRVIPLKFKGAVTYVVISETSFMHTDGMAIADTFFDNNTDVKFWLRTPYSLAKRAIFD